MPRDDSRAELLAIAALYEVAASASKAPIVPSLWLRALLAMLYSRRVQGGRQHYEAFWWAITNTREEDGDGYIRATNGHTQWNGIVRTLGLEPLSPQLHDAISALSDRQRRVHDPEWRAIRKGAERLREGKLDREIIATKGYPHSEAARALMAERISRGNDPA